MNCYKNFIFLVLCLISFSCEASFWTSVEEAIYEHNDAFEKFAPEAADIKVETIHRPGSHQPVKFVYTPETANLKAYTNSLGRLEDKVFLRSCLKSFLVGLPVGFINFIASHKNKYKKEVLGTSLITGLIFSILNVIKENNSYGKHPFFDKYLKRYDNYFGNGRPVSIIRILVSYFMFIMGGLTSKGCSIGSYELIKNYL